LRGGFCASGKSGLPRPLACKAALAAAPSTVTPAAQPPSAAHKAAFAINSDAWRTRREFIYFDRLAAVPRLNIDNKMISAELHQLMPLSAVYCLAMLLACNAAHALALRPVSGKISRLPDCPYAPGNNFCVPGFKDPCVFFSCNASSHES
jgi:hypothetical protein